MPEPGGDAADPGPATAASAPASAADPGHSPAVPGPAALDPGLVTAASPASAADPGHSPAVPGPAALDPGLVTAASAPASAADPGHSPAVPGHAAAEAKPLLQELGDPKYGASRCLLPPLLAANGRVVARDEGDSFKAGDMFIAVDGEALNESSRSALIDILERLPPGAAVSIRLVRSGSERVVTAHCTDAKPFYDALRAGAEAAAADDDGSCADRLDGAARLHGLASVWLRLSMTCKIGAGRLAGERVWRTDYELFRQRIDEARFTPALLDRLRQAVRSAARDLEAHGNARLASRLRAHYALAIAQLHRPGEVESGPGHDSD